MENKNGLPINKAHEAVRGTLESTIGHSAAKVNLRQALDLSLSKKAYVEDMAPDVVEGFKNFNSREQNSIIQYILLADILKRSLWSEIKKNTKDLINSPQLEEFKNQNLNWNETIDTLTRGMINNSRSFLLEWGARMRTSEKDEMYKQRFTELQDQLDSQNAHYHILNTPENLFTAGYNTGVSFPMGMLKHMPELLRSKGIEPTRKNIEEYFKKNLIGTSGMYASQDIYSFGAINNAINPNEDRPLPADFSTENFTLNDAGKITFKQDAFSKAHDSITEKIPSSAAALHVAVNMHTNLEENKPRDPNEKTKYAWKTCPALFANVITEYEDFFKPILDKALEIQGEYK